MTVMQYDILSVLIIVYMVLVFNKITPLRGFDDCYILIWTFLFGLGALFYIMPYTSLGVYID